MKIILLGGSIVQGLGSKKINFVSELQALLPQSEILNWAYTGTTVTYALPLIPKILDNKPDWVIILYGNTDAQIKPNRNGKIFKYLPKRFKGGNGSMILPRPFYSSRWYKRWPQKLENFWRTLFRKAIYVVDGTEQWLPLPDFIEHYTSLCKTICEHHINVLACSTVFIDEHLFPGSNAEYQKYNQAIKNIAKRLQIDFLDVYNLFKKQVSYNGWRYSYNFDHFHPNGNGYKLLAGWLAKALEDK